MIASTDNQKKNKKNMFVKLTSIMPIEEIDFQ